MTGIPQQLFPWKRLDSAWFLLPADSEKKSQTSDFHVKVLSATPHIRWIDLRLEGTFVEMTLRQMVLSSAGARIIQIGSSRLHLSPKTESSFSIHD